MGNLNAGIRRRNGKFEPQRHREEMKKKVGELNHGGTETQRRGKMGE
jgi:hypothetical protein